MSDPIAQFMGAIAAAGLTTPRVILPDGKLHRFASNGDGRDKAAWYVFHLDGLPAGAFGDFRSGLDQTWRADIDRKLSPQELADCKARVEHMRRQREAEDAKVKAEARKEAVAIWGAAAPAPADHPYLANKGIEPHGLRVHEGRLVVPMRDDQGTLHSLQFMALDGAKRFLTDGRVAGCFYQIGEPDGVVCIGEGFATIATVHEITGHAAVAAINKSSLLAVSQSFRKRFPAAKIVLCADDDWICEREGNGNPGLTDARAAAAAVGGVVAVPEFGEGRSQKDTDFNDMARVAGRGAVSWLLEKALGGKPEELPTPGARKQHKKRAAEARAADGFVRGDAGQILKGHPENIRHAISLLSVKLNHNEFSNQTEVRDLPGRRGPEFHDPDAHRLRFLIQETYRFLPSYQLFEHVLIDVAHQNRFHPVREWLISIEWDGRPRIDDWLVAYGGAENTPFNRAVGRIFLIAGVRRVRRPGCKFDTMIVFESPAQGRNKSQAARLLAIREEWFNDNLPLGAKPQEVIEQISGSWIIEFPELAGIATREVEHIKAFLSRQVDKARPAYGRRREDVKRQFVACGTTNDTEYLKNDERRFWPVRIKKFNLETLGRDVDQLWAEAARYEAEGEPITLQEDLWGAAADVRAERKFENTYYAKLAEGFGAQGEHWMKSSDVWAHLGILTAESQAKAQKAVGQALRDLGFERHRCGKKDEPEGCQRDEPYYKREPKP